MEYPFIPKEDTNLEVLMDIGEGSEITRINRNNVWVGDFIEDLLMDLHGDRWISTAEAEIQDSFETDKADFLWDQRQRRYA